MTTSDCPRSNSQNKLSLRVDDMTLSFRQKIQSLHPQRKTAVLTIHISSKENRPSTPFYSFIHSVNPATIMQQGLVIERKSVATVQEGFALQQKVVAGVQKGFALQRKVAASMQEGFALQRKVAASMQEGFALQRRLPAIVKVVFARSRAIETIQRH